MKAMALALLAGTLCTQADAQSTPGKAPGAVPTRNVEAVADAATPTTIVHAVYEIISGEAGRARDWDRFRRLFHPDARLASTRRDPTTGLMSTTTRSTEEYIARNGPKFVEHGFFERELAQRVERVGPIAHVFSSYESRAASTDRDPSARGINSFELTFDGTRWWIVALSWAAETPDATLPPEYDGSSRRKGRH